MECILLKVLIGSVIFTNSVYGQLECDRLPCANGASCANQPLSPYFSCQCNNGYTGQTCQEDINECLFENPCRNGGLCINNHGGYQCHCDPSWSGDQCQILVSKCAALPCMNGATCLDVGDSYLCQCAAGWEARDCDADINECSRSPCENQATCVNTDGSYNCQCVAGYTGSLCETEVDECFPQPCQNNASCQDLINGYVCQCKPGYRGLHCQTQTFECDGVPCVSGQCVFNSDNQLYCRCDTGYTGEFCNIDIQECESDPCQGNGDCVDGLNGFTCFCHDGFIGSNCEEEINECDSAPCAGGATCVDLPNRFRCDCSLGYSGEICSIDIDECNADPCLNGATCIDGNGEYTCTCARGFSGTNCSTNVDDCHDESCENGLCIDGINTFYCQCDLGWTGEYCQTNINDCGPWSCINGGTCVDGLANFTCICAAGFAGPNCELNIDDCQNINCSNGNCQDLVNNYTCDCYPGFTGLHCERETDECESGPCVNGADCTDLLNGFNCTCQPGYVGVNCQIDQNECDSSPCMSSVRCLDEVNSYICVCQQGWTGENCDTEINECLIFEPCYNNATCLDMMNGYECLCAPGFNGSRCELNTDECRSSPCHGDAVCQDGDGDYTCICPVGFTGDLCEEDIQECENSPCLHNATCSEPNAGTYKCTCPLEVTGRNCETVNTITFSQPASWASISGVNLGSPAVLRLDYRTLSSEGVVFSAIKPLDDGRHQLILVELHQGHLHLVINAGVDYTRLSQRLASEAVQVVIQHDGVALSQPPSVFSEDSPLNGTLELSNLSEIYLGTPPVISSYMRSQILSISPFIGCVGNMSHNNQPINLSEAQLNSATWGCPRMTTCSADYCSQTGSCLETWEPSPRCLCDTGYSGEHCEIQDRAEFNPSQMLYLPSNGLTILSLRFTITSRNISQSSLLLYTTEANKMAVTSGDGTVRATMLGVGFILSCEVRNGYHNYNIELTVNEFGFTMAVSSRYVGSVDECSQASSSRLEVSAPLYIGKLHPSRLMDTWRSHLSVTQGFEGCLSELRINNSPLSLSESQPTGLINDPPMAHPGCSSDTLCASDRCQNGATCEGLWDRFTCHCTPGFTGEFCGLGMSVTFDGRSSLITLQVNRLEQPGLEEGSLQFRTRSRGVTLLQAVYSNLEFNLQINPEGRIELQIESALISSVQYDGPLISVNDAIWHSLSWSLREGLITLILDQSKMQYKWRGFYWPNGDVLNVVVGAKQLRTSSDTLVEHFQGCLRNLYSYTTYVPLYSNSMLGLEVTAHNTATDCNGAAVCHQDVCPTNSICVDEWNWYTCSCLEGWQGLNCSESVDDCASVDCGQNGVCCDLHLNYTCQCLLGYRGPFCEAPISACESQPCNGNQTSQCLDTGPLQYSCVCLPGFHGNNCDVEIDECASDLCQNGATCEDGVNGYTCRCTAGYNGAVCQTNIDECASSPCAGDSRCLDFVDNYTCICGLGLTGADCSVDIQECADSPCQFDGTCIEPEPGKYECVCSDWTRGPHCEEVTTVTVDGLRHLELPSPNSTLAVVEMSFTTSLGEGLLLYAENRELTQALVIELLSSDLVVTVLTSHQKSTVAIPLSLSAGTISAHQVQVLLLSAEDQIQVTLPPSTSVFEQQVLGLGDLQLNSTLMIGGTPPKTALMQSLVKSSYFIGCLSNIFIDGQIMSILDRLPTTNHIQVGCILPSVCTNQPNDCSRQGTCVNLWKAYRCECETGYSGNRCEILRTVTLSPTRYLNMNNSNSIQNLKFEINRRESSNGLLLYTLPINGPAAFALTVEGSSFHLRILTVGSSSSTVVNSSCTCVNAWCTVGVQFLPQRHHIYVSCSLNNDTANGLQSQPSFSSSLMFGALHPNMQADVWRTRLSTILSADSCIRNVAMNGLLLNLAQHSPSGLSSDPPSLEPGCPVTNVCQTDTCSGQGQCAGSWNGRSCQCDTDHEGDKCQYAKPWTFDGYSTILSATLSQSLFSLGNSGEIQFRTRATSGSLLQIVSQDHIMAISLSSNGSLILSHDSQTSLINTVANDGFWHQLSWNLIDGQMLELSLNSSLVYSSVTALRWYAQENIDVTIGATKIGSTWTGYFKGCLSNLVINNRLITLNTRLPGLTLTSSVNNLGCHGDEVCSSNSCPETADCVDLWNMFTCSCKLGWHGFNCSQSIDDCPQDACSNHGECIDLHRGYECLCETGYTGAACNTVISACSSTPCQPEYTLFCEDKFPLDFECSCKPGYSGKTCQDEILECSSDPCLNEAQCIDQINGFSCNCDSDHFGPTCQFVHICSSTPCLNGATCIPSGDNSLYVCQCTEAYFGDGCQTFNPCYLNECLHGSTCLADYVNRRYVCQCPDGYYGNRCEMVDHCYVNSCQNGADCIIRSSTYECICTEHYTGEFCSAVRDKCEDSACTNNSTCYFDTRRPESLYECRCAEGYSGPLCETEINECLSDPCINGQCEDRLAGFHCTCDRGWTGARCNEDVPECASSPCLHQGTCIDQLNGYTCFCHAGYAGSTCELDHRACTSNPCLNGASCIQRGELDYVCRCPIGYDGLHCENNIDNCVHNLCQFGSSCVDQVDSYTCDCLPGFTGRFCTEKRDSCFNNPCLNEGVCTYTGLCTCGDVNQFCGFHDETCQRERCDALVDCETKPRSYSCDCSNTGFEGPRCNTDVNECSTGQHSCRHDARCVNNNGSFTCDCEGTGYSGSFCQTDVDECQATSLPCVNGGTCVNTQGSFLCICLDGWTGSDCSIDIQECASTPCFNNSTCIEGVNGFFCVCTPGWTGQTCSVDDNECSRIPPACANGATCINSPRGSFTCHCAPGHAGTLCETALPTAPTSSLTTTLTTPSTSSTTTNTTNVIMSKRRESTDPQISPKSINNTALAVSLVILVVVCIVVVVIVLLYRYHCIKIKNPNKGAYRPDSLTALPMAIQYGRQDRLI